VVKPGQADPVSLIRFRNVLMTKGAVQKIEEMLT
jgi:ribosomal protein L4